METMTRRRWWLVLVVGLLGSCLDDTVVVPVPEPGRPYCMIAGATYGHFADGTKHYVGWQHQSPAGCACIRPDQRVFVGTFGQWYWTDDALTKLNELAYADCQKAAKQWDFTWDECEADYESGKWLPSVWYAGEDGEDANYLPPDLYCTDDLSTEGW
jgi:hypothetical protein